MQASKPRQAGRSEREEIAAAKLSELAAEAQAGWDATTLERLIVKGLTRYYHDIDAEARRALASAEPPLNVLGHRLPAANFPAVGAGIDVSIADETHHEAWLDVIVAGFDHPDTQGVPSHVVLETVPPQPHNHVWSTIVV